MGAFATAGSALGMVQGDWTRSAAAEETPRPGGSVRMSLAFGAWTFDPIVPFESETIWTMLLVYDQLVRVAPDGQSVEPGLAERWEISDDGLDYTFHLRQANFHDGTACTSADVVYSLTRVTSDPGSTWAFLFPPIASMEAPDEATVVIRLQTTWAPFVADLALFAASVIPKAAHETRMASLFSSPIGTGPFAVDSWAPQGEIVLKKNPAYWDAGKPYLDEVRFLTIPDADERLRRFRAGEIDIATEVAYDELPALRDDPSVVVITDPLAGITVVQIDVARPPFDDKALRQAMNYAVDKEAIIAAVLSGAGEPATTFLPKMAMHDDEAPGYPYDLEKAQSLVAESAGKDGFDAELLMIAGDAVLAAVGQMVAVDLAKIGGRITITAVDGDTTSTRLAGGDYDLAITLATTDIADPDELTVFMAVGTGPFHAAATFYDNPELDALAAEAPKMTDPALRADAYKQIQAIHADDAPLIFLYYPNNHGVASAHVKNFHILPTGNYRLWETWRDDV